MSANTIRMRLRGLALVAAVLLLGAGTPAATAAPSEDGGPYRVQMIYRVGKSLAPFDITLQVRNATHAYTFWTVLPVERNRAGWRQSNTFSTVAEGGGISPVVYAAPGSSVPSCPEAPTCSYPDAGVLGADGQLIRNVTPRATSRYYVISAYADVTIDVSSKAWRVKDVANSGARRALADHSPGSTGAGLSYYAERFTEATAPGGRYGSAVFAALPCEEGGNGEARLTARGALDPAGDMEPRHPTCAPTAKAGGFTWAYTQQHATWRLAGDVTGVGVGLTRLFVFDFPKP